MHAIVGAIRHIHDVIIGDRNAMRRVELLRRSTGDLARLRGIVIRFVAVGAPMALIGASRGVKHDHPPIAVTISNKHFIGLCVHHDGRRPAKMFGVVAVGGDTAFADLQQKLSVFGEF